MLKCGGLYNKTIITKKLMYRSLRILEFRIF